ncbi:NAD-dependent epimerase/dehydratase family protein [Bacteroides mediterraneensis]|uniref:NAD-dependent epimerase/dehydratase family protein n=1 Tax=Bacteroides mediterraneensis TaxID=1841856 RepID=UPI000933D99C|nr:NAD(P)-dependent oxidoreductase [Bacteroides mediterraneensis]
MKISIIGTNGFLSVAMAKYCNEQKWNLDMYGLDAPQGHEYNHFYQINLLSDKIDYSELLKSDIIIYASGAGIQSNLHESAYIVYALNVTVPVNLCDDLKVNGYKGIFVSFGSVFEMGQTKEQKSFTEEDIITSLCEAPNDYAVSKRMLTRFISSYKHEFTHWHFIIPTIYGEKENPLRLIPYTINAIKNNEELHFTAGDQTRQYIYVNEVPRLIHLAVNKKLPNGIYNIEGKETLTVKEIVTLIHHCMGKSVPTNCFGTVQRADVGMKFLALNGNKLKEAIGFEAKTKIKDIINKY